MAIEASSQNGHFDLGDAAKKALIGAGAVGAVIAGRRLYFELGGPHILTLASHDKPIKVHRVLPPEIREDHILDFDRLRGSKIIYGGDSQGLPTETRVTTEDGEFSPYQPESMDAFATVRLNKQFPGLGMKKPENYAEPGLQSTGLLRQLRDRESRLRKALVESPGPVIFVFSIGPNDWQEVTSDPNLLVETTSLGESKNERRDWVSEALKPLRIAKTLVSLARGHEHVGENLENTVPEIMQEVTKINEERKIIYGSPPISAVAPLFSANFGDAYAISVGRPGIKETVTVVLSNLVLQRLATMVSARSNEKMENGICLKPLDFPIIPVSSKGVKFPFPDTYKSEMTEAGVVSGKKFDQHVGLEQETLGDNLANAIVACFSRKSSPELMYIPVAS